MGKCIYLRKGEVHTPPVVGIKAGDLPIGQIVKLMEGGVETEFIVVNQGIPENSGLYDASCNGTWLLRKDIKSTSVWNSNNVNTYPNPNTTVRLYLEGDYFNSLGATEQNAIKQIKIPYGAGGGVATVYSGARGYSTKVFLLGGYEVGFTAESDDYFPTDGTKLAYFESGDSTAANNKRIAYLNSSATNWWLRSPRTVSENSVWQAANDGSCISYNATGARGVRPALIIPSTSIFDPTTYLLKK